MIFNRKWWEILAIIASITAIIQFVKLALDSLGGETLGDSLNFLLAIIFVVLFIIIILITKIQEDIRKMKEFLNIKALKRMDKDE